MAISQTNYVDITSAVAGAAASGPPSLQHRRLTKGGLKKPDGTQAAPGEIVTVTYGMLEMLNSILDNSADRALAQQYFSIKTTPPVSKPKSMEFVNFEERPEAGDYVSAVDAYILSRQKSKNFGTFSIEGCQYLLQEELEELKNYHASYNVLHQLYIEIDTSLNVEELEVYKLFKTTPMTAIILSEEPGEYKAMLPAGYIDAVDWEGRNTVNQLMYRESGLLTPDVDDDVALSYLNSLHVNYYGETTVNATQRSFFQRGNLFGTNLDPRDMIVAAAEQWIKGRVASDLINTLVASRIPANLDGKTRIASMIINGAVAAALRSGAILVMKELTQLQKETIQDMTGDELAWADVMNNGYWLEVEIRTVVVNGIEEKHAYYTLIYAKADFVRKIVGSHNLI